MKDLWFAIATACMILVGGILFMLVPSPNKDTWTPTDTSEKCFIRTYDDTRTLYCVMGLKENNG